MEERFSVLLSRVGWVGCLLGLTATAYFLLGLAGFVRNVLLNLSVAAVLVYAALFFVQVFFTIPSRTRWVGRMLWAAILVFLVVEVVLGFLPPVSRDELTHHLAIPRLYADAGRIIEVPLAPYAYYPMLLDMLYTPWVFWGLDFVPKLVHALLAYFTGLLLFAYLSRRMNAIYGLLGFFLFVSTPVVARLSHWGYVDLGLSFYTTASLLALLRWREKRESRIWLALASVSLGFALATKPNGLVAALLISLLFLLASLKPPQKSLSAAARGWALFAAGTALPFLPWLAKNWLQTGNPFYPFLGNLFSSHTAGLPFSAGFAGLNILARREWLYGEGMWQLIGLPLRVFLFGQDDNPQYFDGVLTPVLIIFLPWALKGKWSGEKKLLGSFALLFLLYALFLVDMRIRYILPIVPPLVILAVYGVHNLYLGMKRPAILYAALSLFAVWHGFYLWTYVRDAEPMAYLSGREDRASYLSRRLPEYAALQFINSRTAPTAKIYLLFIGRRAYYCHREYFHDGGELPGYLLGAVRAAKGAEQIAIAFRRQGITHLLVREDLLTDFLTHNLTPGQAAVWNQFTQTRLTLIFRDGAYAVYQLRG